MLTTLCCLGLAATGCADERGGGPPVGPGLTSGAGLDTDGDPVEPDDDEGPRFDVGEAFDVGSPGAGDGMQDEGCQKVDLLFVVDNSGSMEDNQQNLVASFPGFVDQIKTTLADVESYHVGVVTTDAFLHNDASCQEIGALVTSNATGPCGPFASGKRFMTDAEPDLASAFGCAAHPGADGDSNERPMEALQTAISPGMLAGGCNDGFLRDDALLVVVIITDEEDDWMADPFLGSQGSPGGPLEWFDAVVAAKGGKEKNVSVLSIVNTKGSVYDQNLCGPGENGDTGWRIISFTEQFTHGLVGDVCAADYSTVFEDALGVIEGACNDFMPPG